MIDYRPSVPLGHRFHHIGVPVATRLPTMRYIPHLKFAVTGMKPHPIDTSGCIRRGLPFA